MNRHFAVIDPGMKVAEVDCFNHIVNRAQLPCSYHLPGLWGADSLGREPLDQLAGVVVLGSAASVNDRYAWQDALKTWLTKVIDQDVPVLGICYGHQLLAHMHGGKVAYMTPEREKAKGLREIEVRESRVFQAARGQVVVSHNEAVIEVPKKMRVIASSERVRIEGLEHQERPVFSFQAHPEATAGFLSNNGLVGLVRHDELGFGHGLVDSFLSFAADLARNR